MSVPPDLTLASSLEACSTLPWLPVPAYLNRRGTSTKSAGFDHVPSDALTAHLASSVVPLLVPSASTTALRTGDARASNRESDTCTQ